MRTKILSILALSASLFVGDLQAQTTIYNNQDNGGNSVFYGGGDGFPFSRQLLGEDIVTLAPPNAGDAWEVNSMTFNMLLFGNGVSQETFTDIGVEVTFLDPVVTDAASGPNTAAQFEAATVLNTASVTIGDLPTGDAGEIVAFIITVTFPVGINIGDGQDIGVTFEFSDTSGAADNGLISMAYRNDAGTTNEPAVGTTSTFNFRDEDLNGIINGTDNFGFGVNARLRFSLEAEAVPGAGGGFVAPTSFDVFRGIEISGAISDFADSDDVSASYNPGFTINSTEAPVWLIFDGNAPTATDFLVESSAGTPGLEYTVEAFNFAAGSFEEIGVQGEAFGTDQVVTFPIVAADHIDANGDTRSRVGWRRIGFTINFPWQVNVDQAGWNQ